MPSTSKSTKKTAAAVSREFVDAVTPLVLNSVERVADLQKKTLDLAAEQTAELIGVWKKAFSYFPVTPAAFFYSKIADGVSTSVRKSVERSVEAQKKVLELASAQNKAGFESAKKQLGAAAGPATAILDTFQLGADTVIEAQKSFLNMASQPFVNIARN